MARPKRQAAIRAGKIIRRKIERLNAKEARLKRVVKTIKSSIKKGRGRMSLSSICSRAAAGLRARATGPDDRRMFGRQLKLRCGGGMKKGFRYSDEQKMAIRSDRDARAASRG